MRNISYELSCVIGNEVYHHMQAIHANQPVIGQRLVINDHVFTIMGVADKWQRNDFFIKM